MLKRVLLFLFLSVLVGAVPKVINYQGKLTNADGSGVNDTLQMVFRLYTNETGGSPIWVDTVENVVIRQGLFSVELGEFPDSVDFSTQYWLEVEIEGERMNPRERLTSAPYALHSLRAEIGYNPVYSERDTTRRRGSFVFRAGEGATLADDGSTINITLQAPSSPYIPSLALVLGMGNSAAGQQIKNLSNPTEPQDAATKAYVDNACTSSTKAYGMVYRTSSFDLTSTNTWINLPFTGGNYGLVNITHSTTVNPERVIVNTTGMFLILYKVHFRRQSGAHHGVARVMKNGDTEILGSFTISSPVTSDANEDAPLIGMVFTRLNAGDYITLQVGVNLNYGVEIDLYDDANLPDPATRIYAIMIIQKIGD